MLLASRKRAKKGREKSAEKNEKKNLDLSVTKALRYQLFFVKALSKRLWKLTIKTKQL